MQVAPLWYLAQLTFNLSLAKTSVTSNTILSSTSALFTFLFAVALLSEVFTLWKLGFIMLLIVGACGPLGGGYKIRPTLLAAQLCRWHVGAGEAVPAAQ